MLPTKLWFKCHSISLSLLYMLNVSPGERKYLWNSLEILSQSIDGPWCVGGDFNVIADIEEKLGGKAHRMYKSLEFINYMDNCGVTDIGFTSPKFTWCNNRRIKKRVWKRFNRVFINDLWAQRFQNSTIRHPVRTGSDHRPFLMKSFQPGHKNIKYFRFLNFWIKQPGFFDIVKEVWDTQI